MRSTGPDKTGCVARHCCACGGARLWRTFSDAFAICFVGARLRNRRRGVASRAPRCTELTVAGDRGSKPAPSSSESPADPTSYVVRQGVSAQTLAGCLRVSPQVLVEPVQRVLPGLFGCGFVVTGGRVVVEAVIGAFVDMTLVRHLRLREGGIKRWPSVGNPRVELAVLRIYRSLDL